MSDSEDDFVTFGNALEPLDEENLPRKKPVSVEEQCAYDAQGRRRFHGAFTGGFSAGYFNTVGTRDGWRPQQFKSTRSSKAGNLVQRPEDFMDEEDTGEFGIAPTAIRATRDYSDQVNKGLKRERSKQDTSGPIPGTPVLKELLKPVRERVGVMLLKKLGWKPGQGVGPRLTKKEKKQKQKREKMKIYGCSLPNEQNKESDSDSELSDEEYTNITFAPDDYEPYRCNPKDNYFGIGYSGLDRRSILSEHINLFDPPTFSVQDKNKKLSIRGQAFGVGAFETEDDDIYSKEDMSNYDFSLGPERKSKSRWSKEIKQKSDCVEGFVRSKQQLPQKKIFPAPVLPKDFQPIHKVRKSRFSPLTEDEKNKPKRYEMNAESRAKIINDDRPSIIDSKTVELKNSVAAKLITRTLNLHGKEQVAERQRLEQNAPKKSAMSWLDKISSTTFVKGETIGNDPKILGSLQSADTFLTKSNKTESVEDSNMVKPTFADLDKQRRFEQYLNFSESERKLKFASIQPLSMTEWERDQEVEDFEKAVQIHEKIDSLLKTKNEKNEKEKEAQTIVDLESLSLEDRMTAAAKMKMFGKFTRMSEEWKPAKLVCNRFNIAEPFVGVAEEDKKKKKFSIFDSIAWNEVSKFDKGRNLEYESEPVPSTSTSFSFTNEGPKHRIETSFEDSANEEKSKPVTGKEKAFEESYAKVFRKGAEKNKASEIGENEIELVEVEEPTTNIQEKKDLFKSIFLSSSEDSESEAEETSINEEKLKVALIGKDPAEINVKRNTSPPRGVFAKLDLDSLMKRPDKTETSKESSAKRVEGITEVEKLDSNIEKQDCEEKMEEDTVPVDTYGPALPIALPQSNDTLGQKPLLTLSTKSLKLKDGVWVEKSRDKKKSKKEKKKHKHKERSRSKSRKKSKKEKKH